MGYRSDWGGEPPTRGVGSGPQRRARCKVCGRMIRLTQLPGRGATWVHLPGERIFHQRVLEALAARTKKLELLRSPS